MLLIVGIDPGTTLALALLDVQGDIVLLMSGKEINKAKLLEMIMEKGKPIAIACDISRPPKLVEKIAASLSARLLLPKKSLSKKQKLRLLKGFGKPVWKNSHERDALASAAYALRRLRPLLGKIDAKLKIYSGHKLYNDLEEFVKFEVIVEKKSINSAIRKYFTRFL